LPSFTSSVGALFSIPVANRKPWAKVAWAVGKGAMAASSMVPALTHLG
jgi:hypothetical protein